MQKKKKKEYCYIYTYWVMSVGVFVQSTVPKSHVDGISPKVEGLHVCAQNRLVERIGPFGEDVTKLGFRNSVLETLQELSGCLWPCCERRVMIFDVCFLGSVW